MKSGGGADMANEKAKAAGSAETPPETGIAEDEPSKPEKRPRRLLILSGIGMLFLVVAVATYLYSTRKGSDKPARQTAEDLEQLKYDSEHYEREKQKAAQLRDQLFLVRKEDENKAQLDSLLKELDIGHSPDSEKQKTAVERQAKEEEAIAHVIREPKSQPVPVPPPPEIKRKSRQTETAAPPGDTGTSPMFVYSRTFGGAKYVDAAQRPSGPSSKTVAVGSGEGNGSLLIKPVNLDATRNEMPERPVAEEKTRLLYTALPPVTLYEGEMLEAVLVNRVIADTEPAPVICQLARDIYDHSARYVVFPAGSRIIGLSQVVNYKGAHRLFISFHRIILPNGPSVEFPSSRKALKALDETGALGAVSKVDRHWFLQFATAVFFGVLDGISSVARQNRDFASSRAIVLSQTSENFSRVLDNILSQYSSIVPTIRIDQGKTMRIYLNDDLLVTPYSRISDRSYYANR